MDNDDNEPMVTGGVTTRLGIEYNSYQIADVMGDYISFGHNTTQPDIPPGIDIWVNSRNAYLTLHFTDPTVIQTLAAMLLVASEDLKERIEIRNGEGGDQ